MYKLINQLPQPAEQIDKDLFELIPEYDYEHCEMDLIEKRFIHGLIRYFKPKNILEIGVSSGGGSGLILAAIEDMKETTLTSIDIQDKAYAFPTEKVGFVALRKHSDNSKWKLVSGYDPSEVMESFEKKFDFAIIDTAHVHPIETLNFLSALPFLEDRAIVVLHDISLFLSQKIYKEMKNYPFISLATRQLINSVIADKLEPEYYETDLKTQLVNIGAFQISSDTRKYIDCTFESLLVPWAIIPDEPVLESLRNIIKKHYNEKQLMVFEKAIQINQYLKNMESMKQEDDVLNTRMSLQTLLKLYDGQYILFGLRDSKKYLDILKGAGFGKPMEIWDNSNEVLTSDSDIAVRKPHFDIPEQVAVIFTVRAERTYREVISSWPKEIQERSFFFK